MCIAVNIFPDLSVLDKKWFTVACTVICAEGGTVVAKTDSIVYADRIVTEHNHSLDDDNNLISQPAPMRNR